MAAYRELAAFAQFGSDLDKATQQQINRGHWLRSQKTPSLFVDMHWKISFARCKLLMLAYAISATLIFLAWLISISTRDHNMGHIIWTALTRVALMPTVIMVLVTAVMEFSSYAQAGKREVPDKLAARFPAPTA